MSSASLLLVASYRYQIVHTMGRGAKFPEKTGWSTVTEETAQLADRTNDTGML
ncbi:MAG TPA: hypothetical protein VJN89_15435 [Candidatus Acidoferrum sp.]|nr:hypothetical protein [Candidatus Acidoferrum sp.]